MSAHWARWGPTTARGDFAGDGHVDLSDFGQLPDCLSGPAGLYDPAATSSECLCSFNSDGDADVDLLDLAVLQNAFAP